MFKKILVLAALIPGLAGCVATVDDGSYYDHGRSRGRHGRYSEVHREHSHCDGCGHVFRGGIWVVSN